MHHLPSPLAVLPSCFPALNPAERTAVWALRRVVSDAQGCRGTGACPSWSLAGDLARMTGTFAAVFAQREQAGLRRLRVNPPGSLDLTKDERRLIRAVAAAQGDDAALLDNYLFKMVVDRALRARLADAVTTLAAALAVQGHWLPNAGSPDWRMRHPGLTWPRHGTTARHGYA